MTDATYQLGVIGLLVASPIVFLSLFFIVAPYGRHGEGSWGPTIPARLGWVVMELPSPLAFLWFFSQGAHRTDALPLLFAGLFLVHYTQRTFVFPLLMRNRGATNPVVIVLASFAFNCVNGSLNGWAVGQWSRDAAAWLGDPRFVVGIALFVAGMAINLHSDSVLRNLRAPGETGYKIPRGGLYRFVSCPNYLGEIVEWCGWALATWTAAGAAFALFTAVNLVPRAIANHRWYLEKFPDYPSGRRAWLPGVW